MRALIVEGYDIAVLAADYVTKPSNAVRVAVSAPRKRLGEPWTIATVAAVGYRIEGQQDSEPEGGDRG
jgi:two-component system response regulator VanR